MKHQAYSTLMQQHGSHSRQLREAQSLERMAHHVGQLITPWSRVGTGFSPPSHLCEELADRHQTMPDAAEFWDDEARALSWDLASIHSALRLRSGGGIAALCLLTQATAAATL